jgi:hypothetical protein
MYFMIASVKSIQNCRKFVGILEYLFPSCSLEAHRLKNSQIPIESTRIPQFVGEPTWAQTSFNFPFERPMDLPFFWSLLHLSTFLSSYVIFCEPYICPFLNILRLSCSTQFHFFSIFLHSLFMCSKKTQSSKSEQSMITWKMQTALKMGSLDTQEKAWGPDRSPSLRTNINDCFN